MTTATRVLLSLTAVAVCAFVVTLGGAFSRAVDPEQHRAGVFLFWLAVGVLAAVPLWAPACTPSRYKRAEKVVRRASALALLAPLCFFGSIVVHNVSRSVSGSGEIGSAFTEGAVLFAACLTCLLALLWPELSRRGTNHPAAQSDA